MCAAHARGRREGYVSVHCSWGGYECGFSQKKADWNNAVFLLSLSHYSAVSCQTLSLPSRCPIRSRGAALLLIRFRNGSGKSSKLAYSLLPGQPRRNPQTKVALELVLACTGSEADQDVSP